MEVDERQHLDCVIKTVGSRPLRRGVVTRRGVADIIDTHWPLAAQAELSCGPVTELLVAHRLQAPNPVDTMAHWAKAAGVEEVCGMPAARLTEARLGRRAELLGKQAAVLKGESALPMAKEFRIGLEQMHGDLTPLSLEGADEEDPDPAAPSAAGIQVA